MLLGAGTHESSAPDVCAAIAAMINAMPNGRPQRLIWLLLDEEAASTPVDEVERLAAMAQSNGTTIHVLSPQHSEFGRALAAATGGQLIPSCLADRFEAVFESLSSVIGGGYQVRMKGAIAAAASLQVQVHTPEASGEVVYTI
jgi:hypothetical protein